MTQVGTWCSDPSDASFGQKRVDAAHSKQLFSLVERFTFLTYPLMDSHSQHDSSVATIATKYSVLVNITNNEAWKLAAHCEACVSEVDTGTETCLDTSETDFYYHTVLHHGTSAISDPGMLPSPSHPSLFSLGTVSASRSTLTASSTRVMRVSLLCVM